MLDRVQHIALLISRPLFWTVHPAYQTALKHADGVFLLLRWALSSPGASLGVAPKGIGLLLRSIHEGQNKKLEPEIDRLLDRLGATEEEVVVYPNDLYLFGSETERLLALLSRARRNEYVWVHGEEAEWWVQKIRESFRDYARWCGGDESSVFLLFIRHRCTVFAPFYAQSAIESLQKLVEKTRAEFGDELADLMAAMLQYHSVSELSEITSPLYWSWRLVDFGVSKGDLIYQPMLALWNYWPSSRRWAPPPPPGELPAGPLLTPEEAASLLEDVLWKKVETLFAIARQSCGIGVAEPEFAGKNVQSPVFYFAAPPKLPMRAEEYVEEGRSLLYPLVSTCLGSDDPFSVEVAWGILEGNLLALRRERPSERRVAAWYLLLPFLPKSASREEIESDLDFVADKLTFLEFSVGHAARDIDTDVREFATRFACWGGSLDEVSEQVSQSLNLLFRAKPGGRGRIKKELVQLLLLLRQMQALMEKVNSDARQTLRKFRGYLDGAEDFFRRVFAYAPPGFIKRSLHEAILDAYPYHYLQQPVHSLENMRETVSGNLHGLIDASEKGLEQIERSERESQARWTRALSLLVSLLALLIALPQFVPGSALTSETYPHWLARIISLPKLEVVVRIGVGLLIGALTLLAIAYPIYWILRYFASPQDRSIRQIQYLWDLVEKASATAMQLRKERQQSPGQTIKETGARLEQILEQIDEEASMLLVRVFRMLRYAERPPHSPMEKISQRFSHFLRNVLWGPGVAEWLERNARLRQLMALFDLRPDTIPLPRTLCLLHYKGAEFQSRSSISDWEFERSLRMGGFSSDEADRLQEWLSRPANREAIREMECEDFLQLLKESGVTAVIGKRKSDWWGGILSSQRSG